MIIAGTSIGAGMLGLPTISAGMWFYWSMSLLLGTWAAMFLSSQALLEVNLHYAPGSSFNTFVKDLLGNGWNLVNGASVAFVLYILIYAYVSGGGSVVTCAFQACFGVSISQTMAGVAFAVILIACVWWSTWIVDRISVIMMAGMVVTFLLSMSGLLARIRIEFITDLGGTEGKWMFVFVAFSTYLTSFCFHASVPSLVKYFGKKPVQINKCLAYGTLIALGCYTIWILGADGNIPRERFKEVIAAGGNVGDLITAAGTQSGELINRMLESFATMAVATSFLGAGLGLFDYIADLFSFDDSRQGRTKTALVTFLPPTLAGFLWPHGFIYAIGWAGLFATIWSVIVPAMLLRKARQMKTENCGYRVPYANAVVVGLVAYGLVVIVCHALFVFAYLPMYS
jgi:tryptophan-specific transport protein